jgi:hypothetical protein
VMVATFIPIILAYRLTQDTQTERN